MNIITLPANFTANIASGAQAFIGDMSAPLTLILGIILGAIVIGLLVRMVTHH